MCDVSEARCRCRVRLPWECIESGSHPTKTTAAYPHVLVLLFVLASTLRSCGKKLLPPSRDMQTFDVFREFVGFCTFQCTVHHAFHQLHPRI